MSKHGSGRFGKYGDLKRKEKIRQARILKRDDKVLRVGVQPPAVHGRQTGRVVEPNVQGAAGEKPRRDRKPNGEDANS